MLRWLGSWVTNPCLLASLRIPEAGGQNRTELWTIGALGKHPGNWRGGGVLSWIKALPCPGPKRLRIFVSDPTLEFRTEKTKAGYHGAELATVDAKGSWSQQGDVDYQSQRGNQ